MFAITICRRRFIPIVTPKDCIFLHNNAILLNPFSSHTHNSSSSSSSSDEEDNPNPSFSTVSYLIASCGLSSNDAVSLSKKLQIKSPKNSDAVLDLLKNQCGFTAPQLCKIVTRWPNILLCSPDKTLLPKLQFFRSMGVSAAVLAQILSVYPMVLQRSLEKYHIPSYNYYRNLLGSDQRVLAVFLRDARSFVNGCKAISSNVEMLRERGVPESSIRLILVKQPSLLLIGKEKLAGCVDRAAGMGFDASKIVFIYAVKVFGVTPERTLERKMEAYRRCGWSESDISSVFLKLPRCVELSEKKIMAIMDFLVNELGCKPSDVAQCPVILTLSLDGRMKPRCLVARILSCKGLLKKKVRLSTFLKLSEEKFLKRFVKDFQGDIPELLDIYQGKLSPPDMEFNQEVIFV